MTDETKSKRLICSTVELQNTSAKGVICFPVMTNISFCLKLSLVIFIYLECVIANYFHYFVTAIQQAWKP